MSYNVSLYRFVISLQKWFLQPHDVTFFGLLGLHPQTPTGALPMDPARKLPSSRPPANAPPKPKSWICPWLLYQYRESTLLYAYKIRYLRRSAHKAKFPRDDFLLAAGENTRDAVRLGDQCAVDEGEGDSGKDAGGGARGRSRLGYERERGGIGERQADEDDVAELARRRLDDRSVVVSPEDGRDSRRGGQTEPGHRHRHYHRPFGPAQRFYLVHCAR